MTRAAPVGAIVSLYVDLVARVAIGDVIETQTGRRYQALDVRVQARGKHRGRQHMRCLVLAAAPEVIGAVPFTGRVHTIRWYARRRKSRTVESEPCYKGCSEAECECARCAADQVGWERLQGWDAP